ncbi:hypothetical protein JTE90_012264 [Oedothorax gibbosus]|uniref:Zinc finger protein ush n=1 Tax=Oedothorax gibbosus TaxID=931172 RepID=A0AAV6VI90_9ARAC|nr:hypothetical protein JTE90_012264 [Oedothorax gibbosus]
MQFGETSNNIITKGEESFDQVVSSLPGRLYLREFGAETLVLAKQKLRRGTLLGTYKVKQPEDSQLEEEDSLLKISRSDGGSPVHVMLDNEGHWLKLMRNANLPTDANVCLRISGEDIFCTVTKDVNKEVELKVTCQIEDRENAQESEHSENSSSNLPGDINSDEDKHSSSKNSQDMLDFSSESLNEDMHSKSSSDCESMEVERPRNDSDCENSEVQDEGSSVRCQVSPSRDDKAEDVNVLSSETSRSSNGKRLRENVKHQDPAHPPKHHQPPRESIHKCQLCDFTSKDQHALEKHLHSHRNPPIKRPSSKMTNAKSYCEACKIQFMSVDTYHVHKQLYCKGRHEKEDGSSSPSLPEVAFKPGPDTVIIRNGSVNGVMQSTSLIQPQAIYAAISHNPLILLPCSLVNGQGLVPQTGVLPTGVPGIVLQSGIACPTIVETPSTSAASKLKDESLPSRKTSHPIMHFSSDTVDRPTTSSLRKRKMSEGDVLNLKKSCSGASVRPLEVEVNPKDVESSSSFDQDLPLDLSLKKLPCRSPVNRKDFVVSPVCHSPPIRTSSESESPHRSSVVHSHMTSSPNSSYSNDSVHCYPNTIPIVLARQSSIDRASPLPPVLHVDASGEKQSSIPSMPPPKLVKQGNNVCEECNIVFYKYDNYLAHKRHYCAFRRRQLSALAAAASSNQDHSSDDNNSNHSGLNETSQNCQVEEGGKSGPRREEHFRSVITKSSHPVYCCDACGVKFSTSDNLEAHQTYYCIKKADSAMSKAAAMRGENSGSPHGLEPPFAGPEEWKCNYCDATCSSYETIRRHLLTHSELRGFRCIVCGYKGNTLRGMRTHACEHLNNEGSTSVEEFISTKVVAENGIALSMPNSLSLSDDDSDDSRYAKRRDQPERPSTSHRKNTHVHDHSESSSNSPPIVEKTSIGHVPKSNSPVKRETTSSNSPVRHSDSPHDGVNPMAFCNVVIKTENDATTSGDESSSRDGHSNKEFVKFEPQPEYDSDDKPQDLSKSPTSGQSTSVIRRAPEADVRASSVKRKNKSTNRTNPEMKYCKACDITFSHLSNFIAHKKFYCVSRVIQNCIQEAATVQ